MDAKRFERLVRTFDRSMTRRRAMVVASGTASVLVTARLPGAADAEGATPASEPVGTPCPATSSEESEAVARAYFDAFNAGDADALGALLAPDYRHHGALVTDQDRALHQERLRTNRIAFPDGHYEIQEVIADGDLVAVRHVFTGTLQASYAGVAPKGQPVMVRGVHIHRVACGQIGETWNSGDALGLLRQIGALPAPGMAPRSPMGSPTAVPAAAAPATPCPAMTTADSAAIARRWTEDALDKRDLTVLDEIVDPNIVHHAGIFQDEIGRDALRADLEALLAAFSDARFTADVVVADGDRAVVRWTARGTHDGPLQGLAPTGILVVFTGINTYRLACGMIVEGWSEPDSLGLLRQLGVVPEVVPVATPTT